MADQNNPGQFGNREDTEEQAKKGGQASHSGTQSQGQNQKDTRNEQDQEDSK